jgi:hypothetical protein
MLTGRKLLRDDDGPTLPANRGQSILAIAADEKWMSSLRSTGTDMNGENGSTESVALWIRTNTSADIQLVLTRFTRPTRNDDGRLIAAIGEKTSRSCSQMQPGQEGGCPHAGHGPTDAMQDHAARGARAAIDHCTRAA